MLEMIEPTVRKKVILTILTGLILLKLSEGNVNIKKVREAINGDMPKEISPVDIDNNIKLAVDSLIYSKSAILENDMLIITEKGRDKIKDVRWAISCLQRLYGPNR